MSGGFLAESVVHLHPTLRCNFACHHCYSSSAPELDGGPPAETLLEGLATLHAEGYETLSLSGGEPFLYAELDRLVRGARDLGFRVNAVTNATVLARRLEPVAAYLDFVAVSFDGAPATHDRIRGQEGAFDRGRRGLELLREQGVAFGITCCVTAESLADVPWLYEFALAEGAQLLNLRPLALVGRGSELGAASALDGADQARLMLLAEILGPDEGDGPAVHVDLAPATWLHGQLAAAHPPLASGHAPHRLSALVNPLIVDERGQLLPFAYGIDRRYTIGDVADAASTVSEFRRTGWQAVVELLDRAGEALPAEPDAYVDWYDHLTAVSTRMGSVSTGHP